MSWLIFCLAQTIAFLVLSSFSAICCLSVSSWAALSCSSCLSLLSSFCNLEVCSWALRTSASRSVTTCGKCGAPSRCYQMITIFIKTMQIMQPCKSLTIKWFSWHLVMINLVDVLQLPLQLSGPGFSLAKRISEALQFLNWGLTRLLFLGWASSSLSYQLVMHSIIGSLMVDWKSQLCANVVKNKVTLSCSTLSSSYWVLYRRPIFLTWVIVRTFSCSSWFLVSSSSFSVFLSSVILLKLSRKFCIWPCRDAVRLCVL